MGLPPGEKKLSKRDAGWDNTPYLEVASDIFANNFIKYGLLDSNVIFAIMSLSIMRLDVRSSSPSLLIHADICLS